MAALAAGEANCLVASVHAEHGATCPGHRHKAIPTEASSGHACAVLEEELTRHPGKPAQKPLVDVPPRLLCIWRGHEPELQAQEMVSTCFTHVHTSEQHVA